MGDAGGVGEVRAVEAMSRGTKAFLAFNGDGLFIRRQRDLPI